MPDSTRSLRDRYAKLTDSLDCSVTQADYDRLEGRIRMVENLATIENRAISLYDVKRRRFILKVDRHIELLGYGKDDAVRLDDVENYHAMIHADDLPYLYDAEIRMYEFLRPMRGPEKKDYKLVYDYRVRAKDGAYVRFLHQLALFELDRDFNSWILIVLSDVIATYPSGERPRRFLINAKTGKVCLFNGEMGIASSLVTAREREILALLSQGLESKEIAARLGVSASTVNNHRQNILRKTGTANTAQALSYLRYVGAL